MIIDRKREAVIKLVDKTFYIFFRKEGKWRSLDTSKDYALIWTMCFGTGYM